VLLENIFQLPFNRTIGIDGSEARPHQQPPEGRQPLLHHREDQRSGGCIREERTEHVASNLADYYALDDNQRVLEWATISPRDVLLVPEVQIQVRQLDVADFGTDLAASPGKTPGALGCVVQDFGEIILLKDVVGGFLLLWYAKDMVRECIFVDYVAQFNQ
jgi:hypothetical protein